MTICAARLVAAGFLAFAVAPRLLGCDQALKPIGE
jgi:hypothetical protein